MGKLAVNRLAYFISIVFTFLVCYISLYSYSCGNIDPNINITPSYICLLRPVIIVINILLLLYWLLRFKIWFIVALIGIGINYNFIATNYNLFNNTENKTYSGQKVSLITYNVHSFDNEVTGYSAKEFAKISNDKGVDIICFQEYSGNADFTNDMIFQTYKKYYPYYYTPKERSLAVFSKYPIVNSNIIKFEKTNNGALWIDVNVNNKVLRLFNVHMQSTYLNRFKAKMAKLKGSDNSEIEENIYDFYTNNMRENIRARADQANIISNIIDTTHVPVILCGDLNDIPQTYTYNKLKGNMKDGFTSSGKGFGSTYKGLHNLFRIDYIFYSKSITSSKYEIIDYEMSDHNPVYSVLYF